jgi:hypothetical protein
MKMNKLLNICSSVSIAFLLSNNAVALGLGDLAGTASSLQKGSQALQAGQAVAAVAQGSDTSSGLTGILMQQLGVNQSQATGGAGAIFQYAN